MEQQKPSDDPISPIVANSQAVDPKSWSRDCPALPQISNLRLPDPEDGVWVEQAKVYGAIDQKNIVNVD